MEKKDINTVTTFRMPTWFKKLIDRQVAQIIYSNSSSDAIYHYTRTDLIMDSLRKCYAFPENDPDATGNANEPVMN